MLEDGSVFGFGIPIVFSYFGESLVDDWVTEFCSQLLSLVKAIQGLAEVVVLRMEDASEQMQIILAGRVTGKTQFLEVMEVVEGIYEFALEEVGIGSKGID